MKVWDTIHESIAEYYSATLSYEKMLKRLQEKKKDTYYRFILPTNSIVYAFIKKYIHSDEAEEDFQKILFVDEKVKKIIKRLLIKLNNINS